MHDWRSYNQGEQDTADMLADHNGRNHAHEHTVKMSLCNVHLYSNIMHQLHDQILVTSFFISLYFSLMLHCCGVTLWSSVLDTPCWWWCLSSRSAGQLFSPSQFYQALMVQKLGSLHILQSNIVVHILQLCRTN